MALLDTLIVGSVLFFIALLVWARVMKQSIRDCIKELVEIMKEVLGGGEIVE